MLKDLSLKKEIFSFLRERKIVKRRRIKVQVKLAAEEQPVFCNCNYAIMIQCGGISYFAFCDFSNSSQTILIPRLECVTRFPMRNRTQGLIMGKRERKRNKYVRNDLPTSTGGHEKEQLPGRTGTKTRGPGCVTAARGRGHARA